ncbi:hypothetical protein EZV62_007712 [Acer yangbiense]|uniref:Uncharacterized protein n=1 Tax=Acer yangbiense TaxID=1000413 RepID=A0A5C7IB59_9ROSI|nr:hypothetical protein EZV62_007712 [Acer yangbiense]
MRAIKGLKFNSTEFLVYISNIPMLCMTEEIGRFLGSIISDVREVDTGPSSDCLGKYVRVKVAIEVDNSYEWMCHMTRECPIAEKDGAIADEDLLYGARLKATCPPKLPVYWGWGGNSGGVQTVQ